ncbi:MAG: hypothetical protein KAI66_06220, partial [Lentisphaeria bacterium]|nr:hypothetical protein [Lentisphaeria bacterium]
GTGLEELSSIAMGFVAHGLGGAVLAGLPPKKSYLDCLKRAGHWQLSIEWPPGSGVFPHHERSPYNTLNAAGHACETLSLCYAALRNIYDQPHNLFLQGALRAVRNILSCQWENGCFPYRDYGHTTINYTSLVMWCVLNALETLGDTSAGVFPQEEIDASFDRACDFLRGCIDVDGRLLWENGNENSTAKYNMWTYVLTANVLLRCGGRENQEAGERLLEGAFSMRTKSGLLPMRDRGEEITECAFMQADMLLFLLPFSGMLETEC